MLMPRNDTGRKMKCWPPPWLHNNGLSQWLTLTFGFQSTHGSHFDFTWPQSQSFVLSLGLEAQILISGLALTNVLATFWLRNTGLGLTSDLILIFRPWHQDQYFGLDWYWGQRFGLCLTLTFTVWHRLWSFGLDQIKILISIWPQGHIFCITAGL